jgi:cell division protein FtsB
MSKQGSTWVSLGLGAAILYLGANAVTGQQGLMAYVGLQAREHALEQNLSALRAEEAQLRERAARLKPASLDLDYLDERARVEVAASDPDEVVFALDGGRQGH